MLMDFESFFFIFFFNDTATTEIYTLSLHDALPILTREPKLSANIYQTQPIILDEDGTLLSKPIPGSNIKIDKIKPITK